MASVNIYRYSPRNYSKSCYAEVLVTKPKDELSRYQSEHFFFNGLTSASVMAHLELQTPSTSPVDLIFCALGHLAKRGCSFIINTFCVLHVLNCGCRLPCMQRFSSIRVSKIVQSRYLVPIMLSCGCVTIFIRQNDKASRRKKNTSGVSSLLGVMEHSSRQPVPFPLISKDIN